jgi:peptidoglycan-N-acetylglucosamine deacetylase
VPYTTFMSYSTTRLPKTFEKWLTFFTCIILASCGNASNKYDAAANTNDTVTNSPSTARPLVPDSNTQYIYMSFDDGPQPGTMNCYHVCEQLGIKATFFMVGLHAEEKPRKKWIDSIRRQPLFLIANHSYTHAFKNHYQSFYGQPNLALADFMKAHDSLHVPLKIARLPGNDAWALNKRFKGTKQVKPLLYLLDSAVQYMVLGWDVEWKFKAGDKPIQSAQALLLETQKAMTGKENFVKKHTVILAHDRMFRRAEDRDSLYTYLAALKAMPNVVFETLDNYPGVKK